MTEVFRNPPGRAEAFVSIEVHVTAQSATFELSKLDGTAKRRLVAASKGAEVTAVKGMASISWKSPESRATCIADHNEVPRLERWKTVQKYAGWIKEGRFPQHGHVYLHPSVTGKDNLEVIDGTRRLLAYLEAGQMEMPVIILRAPHVECRT